MFDIGDLLSVRNFPKELTKQDLLKISSDYSEMVIRHRSLPKLSQTVSTRQMKLDGSIKVSEELIEKKVKVLQVRQRE